MKHMHQQISVHSAGLSETLKMFLTVFLYPLCFMFLLVAFFPLSIHSLSFSIPQFDDNTAKNIAYDGDGSTFNGSIELIGVANLRWRVGRASYSEQLFLWDSRSRTLTDFTTHFSFSIDPLVNLSYSDGFTFYLASPGYPLPPNSAGGYLALFNSTTGDGVRADSHIIFVEFDTWANQVLGDPGYKHVGINSNSIKSLQHAPFEIEGNEKKRGYASINYNASTHTLTACWSFDANNQYSPKSCVPPLVIDLRNVLPEWVTIGFSAATGDDGSRHIIHSWEFNSTLNSGDPTPNSGDPTSNSGDPLVPGSKHGIRKAVVIIVIAAVCLFSFVLAVVLGVTWLKIKKKKKDDSLESTRQEFDLERASIFPRRFHYQELVEATNGFADDRKLGRGGSGQVYKAVLSNLGRIVAVKRIFADFENSERIFTNEVKIISRLIHKNLVRFIGWCHEQGELLLVFEYMPNGSLDNHLFGNGRNLPWNVRYKIALGMVSAIHYLHEEANDSQCVLHRDIKSANVLLDTDFCTKLGDFGVAKLVDPRFRTQLTGVVGTLGYLPPEYVNQGRVNKESDMYSFGVVALEIACGRRTYEDGEDHIPLKQWVWQLYVEGTILNAADEKLNREFDEDQMKCLLTVGLWCTHPNDKERPKAAQVIKVLQFEAPMPVLPDNMHDPASGATHGQLDLFVPPVTTIHHEARQFLNTR